MELDHDEMIISGALDALEQDTPVPELMDGIERKLGGKRKRRPVRFITVLAAVVALLGITAAAAALGGLDWLRSTGALLRFDDAVEPVEVSAECEGIKAEVIAAGRYDNIAVMYISLEDTYGQGRITEDAAPGMGYSIGGDIENIDYQQIYYDEELGKNVYMLRLTLQRDISVENVPLVISSVSYDSKIYADLGVDLDLKSAAVECSSDISDTLTPGRLADIPGTEAWVSAVGLSSDGILKVQLGQASYYASQTGQRYVLRPYLVDAEGNRLERLGESTGFATDENGEPPENFEDFKFEYHEYRFDLGADGLDGYTLCFEGKSASYIRGKWELTVDFDTAPGLIRTTADIQAGDSFLEDAEIIVSPVGVSVFCENVTGSNASLLKSTVLETENGNLKCIEGFSHYATNPDGRSELEAYVYPYLAIDLDTVTAIRIGDTRIELDN